MRCNTKAIGGGLVLAALAWLAVGCARHEDRQTSTGASPASDVVAANAPGTVASPPSTSGGWAGAVEGGESAASSDSLPPDVVASVTDTLVTPGTIIEITAEGSADVQEVILSDGIGKKQRFTYDPGADLWRVSYRVPMKIPSERLGLSVTARSDIGRWRRVWVFLDVQREAAKEQAETRQEK